MSAKSKGAIAFLAFVCGYLVLIGSFKFVDVYHSHFAAGGPLVFVYNVSRLLFIFYLFWIIEFPGAALLRVFGLTDWRRLTTLERLTLGFFTGAGVWHVVLLGLGYLGLYKVWVAITTTVPLIIFSFPAASEAIRELRNWATHRQLSRSDRLAAIALAIAAVLLLMVKGLYPGGGSDYFSHYFYYYQTVVDRGNLWPNEVWYHYYESQGAGLFFLSMLLTDPLAPQLVTACFVAAAAIVIFLMIGDATSRHAWGAAGAFMFLAIYIYSPIWGQFEKQHELTAALVIAIAWLSARALAASKRSTASFWLTGSSLAIVAAAIITHVTAIFLGAAFGLLALCLLLRGEWGRGLISCGFAAVAGFTFIALEAIDYFVSGLIDDRPILLTWRLADVEKLWQLSSLPEVVKLYWGAQGMSNASLSLAKALALAAYALRLELLFPLIVGGLAIAFASTYSRVRFGFRNASANGDIAARNQLAVLSTMIVAAIASALTLGRVEPVSFYRYSSFAVPVMIVIGISLWSMPISPTSYWAYVLSRHWSGPPAMALSIVVMIFVAPPPSRTRTLEFFSGVIFFRRILPDAARFAVGNISVDQAYTRQVGWPDKPWGAIYPGARGAYAVVGPGVPIWSMHTTTFCMLPGCLVESVDSFSLGRGWVALMFGAPERGRAALQASGRNYFLISRELTLDDYLPRSPLFAPDNIGRYLGVRWTDGTTTLLTWLGPGIAPVSARWLADYRRQVERSGAVQSFPYDDMKAIFARLRASPHPWRWFALPWGPHRRRTSDPARR